MIITPTIEVTRTSELVTVAGPWTWVQFRLGSHGWDVWKDGELRITEVDDVEELVSEWSEIIREADEQYLED